MREGMRNNFLRGLRQLYLEQQFFIHTPIQVHLSVSWCARRTHDSAMQTQSQVHTSRLWDSAAGDLAVRQTSVLFLAHM